MYYGYLYQDLIDSDKNYFNANFSYGLREYISIDCDGLAYPAPIEESIVPALSRSYRMIIHSLDIFANDAIPVGDG